MKHFNFKSLAFYGVAIASVLILFKVVTAYGETNLKAPAPISGSYRMKLAQNLSICPKSSELILDIQQSGIYLNGSLLPANVNEQQARSGEKSPSLTGKISNQQITLAGKITKLCNPQGATPLEEVTIQSQVHKESLKGQLILESKQPYSPAFGFIPEQIAFTAQRLAPAQEQSSSH